MMTYEQAIEAMESRAKVEAGTGQDHDTGRIVELTDEDTAMVAWDSGVATTCALIELELL